MALPAFPTWIISPVRRSSALRTGQPLTSALASTTSNFVPMILNDDSSGFIGATNSTSFLYRFGGESVVGRSSEMPCLLNLTEAESLLIFLRKKEAMTVVGVW